MEHKPDWKDSTHSYATALALARASRAAYCSEEYKPSDWAEQYGFSIEDEFVEGGMYGYAAAQADTIVFAFRGTDGRNDWAVNIDMGHTLVEPIPGRIHEGFWHSGLGPLLSRLIGTLEKKSYQSIWITGHSLGGAIAVLFHSSLIFQHERSVTGIYTFGQPRVGNKEFRDGFNSKTNGKYHRYINHNDVVPLVPPHVKGYSHAGSPIRFGKAGGPEHADGLRARVQTLIGDLDERLDSLLSMQTGEDIKAMLRRIRNKPGEGVREHAIDEYIAAIEKAVVDELS